MKKKSLLLYTTLCSVLAWNIVNAGEIKIPQEQNTKLYLSIYNNNLGFVKDTRKVNLGTGISTIAFEGVSEKMKAETAMLNGSGINVLEQNYDYAVLSPSSILEASIGQKVRIATTNPQTGENILTPAEIVASNNGKPILKFNHGYETLTSGRIIYNDLPSNLRTQPTLVITLNNNIAEDKEIELAYLTQGLNWKADYIAEITSDNELNLNGLVTLNNNSGTDYNNAHIQLIAGNVNHNATQPKLMRSMNAVAMVDSATFGISEPTQERISDYHMYTLPNTTTITDKQVKQVNLMNRENVKFEKEYKITSPLSLSLRHNSDFFEKKSPQVVFEILNDKASGLGEPIPAGVVRLYKKDRSGNLQFIGEDNISHTPVKEKIELNTGKAFDITIDGKITSSKKISNNLYNHNVAITFKNSSDKPAVVIFVQNFSFEHELIAESNTSNLENANRRVWKINIAPNSQSILTFEVKVSDPNRTF